MRYSPLAKIQLIAGVYVIFNLLAISLLIWLILGHPFNNYPAVAATLFGFLVGEACGIAEVRLDYRFEIQKIVGTIATCAIAIVIVSILSLHSIYFQAAGMVLGFILTVYLLEGYPNALQKQHMEYK